jgi:hypothetical protein
MSRLYDEWKKTAENKLPKVFRKTKTQDTDLTSKNPQISINIPLKGGPERVELSENFLKVIEREYAVRYLETIGVEPTRKNIEKVLKEMPIENCDFDSQWWQPSDWLADTLIIVPHSRPKPQKDLPVSNQLAIRLENQTVTKDLPREESKLTLSHFRKPEAVAVPETEPETKIKIDLDPQNIKKRFLLPFMDNSLKLQGEEEPEDLLVSKMFRFPFESVSVPAAHIKEMMQPIEITVEEVANNLKYVVNSFPETIVPPSVGGRPQHKVKGVKTEKGTEPASPRDKKLDQLRTTLRMVESENNARLIGIVSHFCYWTIFGHLHSIGISNEQRQQMFVTIIHLFNEKSVKGQKPFYKALLILIIRIISENIFANSFKQFFSIAMQAQAANQRLQCVISKLFDPEGYFSRFSFLESGMDALGANLRAKTKMSAKYFSTSSMVKSLFPYPQHPRTRAMFAKKEIYEGRIENLVKTGAQIDGTMPLLPGKLNYYQQAEPWKSPDYLDIPSRAHLFMIALQKMKKNKI